MNAAATVRHHSRACRAGCRRPIRLLRLLRPGADGHTGNHYSDQDTANFLALLAEFRAQLGSDKLLTAALQVGPKKMSKIEIGKTGMTADDAVTTYLGKGFPAGKITVGVPCYAREWSGVAGGGTNGRYQPATGSPAAYP